MEHILYPFRFIDANFDFYKMFVSKHPNLVKAEQYG